MTDVDMQKTKSDKRLQSFQTHHWKLEFHIGSTLRMPQNCQWSLSLKCNIKGESSLLFNATVFCRLQRIFLKNSSESSLAPSLLLQKNLLTGGIPPTVSKNCAPRLSTFRIRMLEISYNTVYLFQKPFPLLLTSKEKQA